MIKILKPGKKYRTFYRTTCKRCGCEFEFDEADIHREYDGPVIDSYVRCPNEYCKAAITKWEELTEEID